MEQIRIQIQKTYDGKTETVILPVELVEALEAYDKLSKKVCDSIFSEDLTPELLEDSKKTRDECWKIFVDYGLEKHEIRSVYNFESCVVLD